MQSYNGRVSWEPTYEKPSWREQISLGPFTTNALVFQTDSIQRREDLLPRLLRPFRGPPGQLRA